MDAVRIVSELRRLAARRATSLAEFRAPIAAWAERHGLGPALIRLVLHAPVEDARLAALALREVSSEFVRRAVVRSAIAPEEPRRALVRVACRPDEVPPDPLREQAMMAELAGLIATAPELFAEWLAETRSEFSVTIIESVEVQRARLGLDPATTWAPLLARRCSAEARERIHQLLGRAPGGGAHALLEKEERRAASEESARSARRERMRQSVQATVEQPREGAATWSLGPEDDVESLCVVEPLPSGETLRTKIRLIGGDSVEWWSDVSPRPLDPGAALSLGGLRSFLEGLSAARRQRLAPLVARLERVELAALVRAVPGAALDLEAARALVAEGPEAAWRPLETMAGWTADLLSSGREDPREAWPPRVELIAELARTRLEAHLSTASAASAAAHRLHRFSAWLRVQNDPRAESVAGEAVLAARGRTTSVLVAWAERELALRLPWQAPLVLEYRSELRALLRDRVGADLEGLRTLDLAQAALESIARESAAGVGWPGLPPILELPIDQALVIGSAVAALWTRLDGPDRSAEALDFELRAHGFLSTPVRKALVEFVVRGCLRECPRRCFSKASGEVSSLIDGELPVALDLLVDAPKRRFRKNS